MAYTKLSPKLMQCNFNFEMMMSAITPLGTSDELQIDGNFRTIGDYGALNWETEDAWGHPSYKYPTDHDFTDVLLEFDYLIEGYMPHLDDNEGMTLTVELTNGSTMYVRLWNYVTDRPEDEWEDGGGELWPNGRTPGSATGLQGHIELDFNNLYAGWRKYDDYWVNELVGYWDDGVPKYESVQYWELSDDWDKIDQTSIKTLSFGFSPPGYTPGSESPLVDSQPFKGTFTNWTVSWGYLGEEADPIAEHLYRLADGYDDNYNVTPERLVEQFYNLGFRGPINMYVGASHYYDKSYVDGSFQQKMAPVFNKAFIAWWNDFLARANDKGFTKVIASVSMESVDAPPTWWQRSWDGTPATSGWIPTPHFVSFCNEDAKIYYKDYVKELADSQNAAGLPVSIQHGEPWWWWQESDEGKPPCFYDDATKAAHLSELGKSLPIFVDSWGDFTGREDSINWLSQKNGLFTQMLRDHARYYYPDAEFTVLFFPPAVLDVSRVGPMMRIVNFPQEQWRVTSNTDNLDFFQVEDYDWLIFDQAEEHKHIYDFAFKYLGYQFHRTHYFAGFVLNHELQTSPLWQRIDAALMDGVNEEFESFIWAGAQIRRDGWLPPLMTWKSRSVSLSSVSFA